MGWASPITYDDRLCVNRRWKAKPRTVSINFQNFGNPDHLIAADLIRSPLTAISSGLSPCLYLFPEPLTGLSRISTILVRRVVGARVSTPSYNPVFSPPPR